MSFEAEKSKLDEQLSKLREYAEFYKGVTGLTVPKTIDDAISERWEKVAEDIGADFVNYELGSYDKESAARDLQHLISSQHAIEAILDLENAMVNQHVDSLAKTAIKQFSKVWHTCAYVMDHGDEIGAIMDGLIKLVVEAVKKLFSGDVNLGEAFAGIFSAGLVATLGFIITAMAKAADKVNFKTGIKELAKLREVVADRNRKRCFVKVDGSRFRRRHVAR